MGGGGGGGGWKRGRGGEIKEINLRLHYTIDVLIKVPLLEMHHLRPEV